jgi:hypothetical protein
LTFPGFPKPKRKVTPPPFSQRQPTTATLEPINWPRHTQSGCYFRSCIRAVALSFGRYPSTLSSRMLRSSIVRAASSRTSSSILPSTASRPASVFRTAQKPALCLFADQQQTRGAHAISNPTLANIEKRWEEMAPQEQADLWMALRDRMKTNWHELTLAEKKAGT